nr:MAG TPA: zinc-ribbon protein [Caudoviricetes sp.]
MATLKDHQQAMVDLLASGSGIPASASRLAHAMHDVLGFLSNETMHQKALGIKQRVDATTPGLNDKALAGDIEACRPKATPAERRVKELENTVKQLRVSNQKLRGERDDMTVSYNAVMTELRQLRCSHDFKYRSGAVASHCLKCGVGSEPEQAGCRKEDTQVCYHESAFYLGDECPDCGEILK